MMSTDVESVSSLWDEKGMEGPSIHSKYIWNNEAIVISIPKIFKR